MMKKIMSVGLLSVMMFAGSVAPAVADSWLDSMGEGSGLDRQISEGGSAPQVVDAGLMRAAVENTIDHSFDFNKHIENMHGTVTIPAINAGEGEEAEE